MGFDYDPEIPMDEAQRVLDIRDAVSKQLASSGFYIPQKPTISNASGVEQDYQGEIPFNLTKYTDSVLGDYLFLLTGWISYVGTQKSLADMSRTVAKAQLETLEAKLRLKNKMDGEGKRISNPERDDIIAVHRQVVEAKSVFMHLEFYYVFVAQTYKNAEQNYAAVSRRITQTVNSSGRDNRNTNLANTKPTTPPMFRGKSPGAQT